MKSKLALIVFIFTIFISNAQTKVGTINSEFIIGIMPESKKVVTLLNKYAAKLDTTYQKKVDEYKVKVNAFQKLDKGISDNYKKLKVDEIAKIEQEIKQNQKNGNTLIQLKRDELMRPLYKKLSEAISSVAKANSYTQILTTSGNEFAFIDEKFDITQLVMDKLGVKIPEAKK